MRSVSGGRGRGYLVVSSCIVDSLLGGGLKAFLNLLEVVSEDSLCLGVGGLGSRFNVKLNFASEVSREGFEGGAGRVSEVSGKVM